MSEFSTNVGLNSAANKQYGIARQVKPKQTQEYEGVRGEKGSLPNELSVDITNPHVDEYVSALEEKGETAKTGQRFQPTIENLKERYSNAIKDQLDNAHNMLAEAFYGFKAGAAGALLNVLGADPAELAAIRKSALDEAKSKVHAGFERLAQACSEHDVYTA
jgi:hypothetical protein